MNTHEYPFMVACLCASRLLFLRGGLQELCHLQGAWPSHRGLSGSLVWQDLAETLDGWSSLVFAFLYVRSFLISIFWLHHHVQFSFCPGSIGISSVSPMARLPRNIIRTYDDEPSILPYTFFWGIHQKLWDIHGASLHLLVNDPGL